MKLLFVTLLLLQILSVIGQGNITVVPVPSSSVAPSSSVTPSPTPSPLTVFCYSVVDTKNRTCVSVCLDAFNVTTTFNASTKHPLKVAAKPARTIGAVKVTGACSSTSPGGTYNESQISLSWGTFNLTFYFSSNIKKIPNRSVNANINQWYLSFVLFTNGTDTFRNETAKSATIGATIGKSYKCDETLSLHMVNATNVTHLDTIATVYLTNYTVQAFASPEKPFNFGATLNCATTATLPAYIPIIVGCALAGLVLLVLVAYVIGRCFKRKQEDYETLS